MKVEVDVTYRVTIELDPFPTSKSKLEKLVAKQLTLLGQTRKMERDGVKITSVRKAQVPKILFVDTILRSGPSSIKAVKDQTKHD